MGSDFHTTVLQKSTDDHSLPLSSASTSHSPRSPSAVATGLHYTGSHSYAPPSHSQHAPITSSSSGIVAIPSMTHPSTPTSSTAQRYTGFNLRSPSLDHRSSSTLHSHNSLNGHATSSTNLGTIEAPQLRERANGPSTAHFYDPTTDTTGIVSATSSTADDSWSKLNRTNSSRRATDLMSFSNILTSSEPTPKSSSHFDPVVDAISTPTDSLPRKGPKMFDPIEDATGPSSSRSSSRFASSGILDSVIEPASSFDETDVDPSAVEGDTSLLLNHQDERSVGRSDRNGAKKTRSRSKLARSSTPSSSKAKPTTSSTLESNSSSSRRTSSKRQANGQVKQSSRVAHVNLEKRVLQNMERLDAETKDTEIPVWEGLEEELSPYKAEVSRKQKEISEKEVLAVSLRRADFLETFGKRLNLHAEKGRRRYEAVQYDSAMSDVRQQETVAEKERKKDMQRKRRREKSMAATMEQKEMALERARQASDEAERQKHLRDAEKMSKKAEQTKFILETGYKGPMRSIVDFGMFETSMGDLGEISFVSMDADGRKKRARPKKSKEKKQAEKEAAEAAQAALDAGEELPAREEPCIRIKLSKNSKARGAAAAANASSLFHADDSIYAADGTLLDEDDSDSNDHDEKLDGKGGSSRIKDVPPEVRFETKGFHQIYDQIWRDLARKDVPKVFKLACDSHATKVANLKKTALLAGKEARRWQMRTNKGVKDQQARAKRVMRDMMSFWKRNEREERDLRKAAEKQELENQRREEADREAARQKRKLNFLISQTELYSHFIGKKIKTDEVERSTDHPDETVKPKGEDAAHTMDIEEPAVPIGGKVTDFENLDFDNEDESHLRAAAMANAQNAIAEAQKKARQFNEGEDLDMDEEGEMNFQNPTGMGDVEIEQPKLLNAQLKEYQLKGLNWLVNLYEQGINGILADEMGLGKTVQSISVMAYLAEKYDMWGPFLVVSPASTLHNWEQEIRKFVPEFKILPYWGNAADRKVLRKFWDRKHSIYKKDAPFHVCVTSYQMVVSDVAFFQKMRWQYMILDEAQAIKSSQSSRWKCLLSFHCRNRLLLTGTPIQNNMQELWALLHFIMPSLFDSHDEFSEWFSKDIESHATSNTKLNEDQLKRLHMILKPFMLRRVKKHVQKELGDKIELDVFCDLTYRQREYYDNLRNQISLMDLIEKATLGDDNDSGTLMNLVMQFRKVCNHPDLFERAETSSPYSFSYFAETPSFVREGALVPVSYSARNLIEYRLPRLLWREGGRLDRPGRDNQTIGFRHQYLTHLMNIYRPDYIEENAKGRDGFSWLRFVDHSATEVCQAAHTGLLHRATELYRRRQNQGRSPLSRLVVAYDDDTDSGSDDEDSSCGFTPLHSLFHIRERLDRSALAEITQEGILHSLHQSCRAAYLDSGLSRLELAARPRATAPPIEVYCSSSATLTTERNESLFPVSQRRILYGPNEQEEKALVEQQVSPSFWPVPSLFPTPDREKARFTDITVPSMRRFVTDSGKLAKLDELLFKLKNEGHRVLLYFQMTRMIDLMEEYLTYRNYKYCRLDGSTKLEDRRDTVHDFQTRPEIFIFLLSTRAGGLGINLTSADTVIFYDSDWNPTIDSQAMDRAHRLGQKKQVTVYRLITRGTIEERIRKRALQKEEVQRVVITGGGASVDFSGRRAPENRNRDIAMWLADDDQAELIEKREREMLESGEYDRLQQQQKKKGGAKRKRTTAASRGDDDGMTLDDMYHEGEGHFDDPSGTATPMNGEGGGGGGGVGGGQGKAEKGGLKKRKVSQKKGHA